VLAWEKINLKNENEERSERIDREKNLIQIAKNLKEKNLF
jgi:hypothetical protein